MANEISKLRENFLEKYCQDKKYNFKKTPNTGFTRFEVSNRIERITLNLYDTGTLVVQGSPKAKLKQEFEEVKTKLNESPEMLDGVEKKVKACATKYSILLEPDREKIKVALGDVDGAVKYYENPTPSEEYRAKLTT